MPHALLAILYVAQLGAAQNLNGEPECAIGCLSSAISLAGCSETDQACQCGPTQSIIGNYALPCLVASCQAAELVAVQSVGEALCSQYSSELGAASGSSNSIETQAAPTTSAISLPSSQSAAASGPAETVTQHSSNSPSTPSSATVTPHVTNSSPSSSIGTAGPAIVTLSPATVTLTSISQSAGGGAVGTTSGVTSGVTSGATSGATSSNGSGLGGGTIAGIVIGAVAGATGIVALLWFLFYRRRRTGVGVNSGRGIANETPELGGKEKTTPLELHGQHRPAELGPGGEWPVELGPGGGWPAHEQEKGND